MTRILGVDIGGAFTDFVSYEVESGRIETWKNLTTPAEPIEGAPEGLCQTRPA